MSESDVLIKQIVFWPVNVIPALLRGDVLPCVLPLFGGLAQYWWFRASPYGMRLFMSYVGAGIANTNVVRQWVDPFQRMYVGHGRVNHQGKDEGADVSGPGDTLGGAGPLGNYQLAPITAFMAVPPVPRYPLGAGGHYALHQEDGWNEGGMSSVFSGLNMK